MGWIVLGVFCGFVLGFFGFVGYLELGYRRRRRRVVNSNGHCIGIIRDDRERRRLIQRELDKLGR